MGLPWIRLDTSFPTNPKVLELVESKRHKAAFGYVCGLTYAGLHGTDGFIPAGVLAEHAPTIGGTWEPLTAPGSLCHPDDESLIGMTPNAIHVNNPDPEED